MRRLLLALVSATLVSATLVTGVLPASPASAATSATCSASTCQGRDPQAHGCSADAITLTEITFSLDRMEMRYSRRCGAVWSRCTTGNVYFVNNSVGILIYDLSDRYTGKYTALCSNARKGDVRWTPMARYTGQWLRTCGENDLEYGGPGPAGDWRSRSNSACSSRR